MMSLHHKIYDPSSYYMHLIKNKKQGRFKPSKKGEHDVLKVQTSNYFPARLETDFDKPATSLEFGNMIKYNRRKFSYKIAKMDTQVLLHSCALIITLL